jgi:hypothetical protein
MIQPLQDLIHQVNRCGRLRYDFIRQRVQSLMRPADDETYTYGKIDCSQGERKVTSDHRSETKMVQGRRALLGRRRVGCYVSSERFLTLISSTIDPNFHIQSTICIQYRKRYASPQASNTSTILYGILPRTVRPGREESPNQVTTLISLRFSRYLLTKHACITSATALINNASSHSAGTRYWAEIYGVLTATILFVTYMTRAPWQELPEVKEGIEKGLKRIM